ncbi:hypothetical protein RDI58_010496 [Solanum bulbocastanum]|uniref:Uncharacterized protein n=1 Tax=Solanum bulbocastanum TaxID=147425 RepID=A0AAN8TQM3_SOLBU
MQGDLKFIESRRISTSQISKAEVMAIKEGLQ